MEESKEIWFSTNYSIPEECSREYMLKSIIGKGQYGSVYEACKNSNCNFVIRITNARTEVDKKDFYREAYISALMGTNNVGPLVYRYWICDWSKHGGTDIGMILMDRLDITL